MATLRNTAIGYHRANGDTNIARATRRASRRPHDLITAVTSGNPRTQCPDLPHLHTFTRGLGLDAVNAALTHPFHNGGTEGVNTKTKLIKRQMYGRAGFALLRHRILLG